MKTSTSGSNCKLQCVDSLSAFMKRMDEGLCKRRHFIKAFSLLLCSHIAAQGFLACFHIQCAQRTLTSMFQPEAFTQVMQLVLNPLYNLSLQANFIIILVSSWSQNTSTSALILIRHKLQANKLRWQFPTQATMSWAAITNANSKIC